MMLGWMMIECHSPHVRLGDCRHVSALPAQHQENIVTVNMAKRHIVIEPKNIEMYFTSLNSIMVMVSIHINKT
jgi:hypothetical protein